jgi:hypothetical protein
MVGLIYNSRGVKRRGFVSFLKDNIRDFGVDFVGIQETMLKFFLIVFSDG